MYDIYIYIYIYVCIYIYIYIFSRFFTCLRKCLHTLRGTNIYIYIYIYIHIHICVYVYIYIYIYSCCLHRNAVVQQKQHGFTQQKHHFGASYVFVMYSMRTDVRWVFCGLIPATTPQNTTLIHDIMLCMQ